MTVVDTSKLKRVLYQEWPKSVGCSRLETVSNAKMLPENKKLFTALVAFLRASQIVQANLPPSSWKLLEGRVPHSPSHGPENFTFQTE